jgi:hypothetical protein
MSYFPHEHTATPELLKELKSMLVWSMKGMCFEFFSIERHVFTIADQLTSLKSLSAYTVGDLKRYIYIVDQLAGILHREMTLIN